MTAYNPYEHAEELGLKVIHRALTVDTARWLPDSDTIVVRSGLPVIGDRSALAHEIGHAAYGHSSDSAKHEKQADRFAAVNLIDFDKCLDAMRATPDEYKVALELGVTRRILRAFLNLHRLAE